MSLYLVHLNLLSRLIILKSTNSVYQLVNAITCEIIYPSSPNSVCGSLLGIINLSWWQFLVNPVVKFLVRIALKHYYYKVPITHL